MPDPTNKDPWAGAAPSNGGTVGAGVLLWDNQAGRPSYVPVTQMDEAIKSGKYSTYGSSSVVTTTASGTAIPRTPAEGQGAVVSGESQEHGTIAAAAAAREAQKDAFRTLGDGVDAFLDGLKDSLSLGLIHDHGEQAEVRNSAHKGAHFAGATTGFLATALVPGAAEENAARAALGKALSKTPLGLAESALRPVGNLIKGEGIAARAAREAVINAGLSVAYDVGHQASDALIDDKPFSAEHVLNEVPIGMLLGGTFGAAGALVSKLRGRSASVRAMESQDGLLNPESATSQELHQHVQSAVDGFHRSLESNQAKLAIFEKLERDGQLPELGDFIGPKRAAMAEALKARKALEGVDLAKAMASGDVKAIQKAADLVDNYGVKVSQLDEAMRVRDIDVATLPRDAVVPGPANLQHQPTGMHGEADPWALELDRMMENPELRRVYREMHGRDYEPLGSEPTAEGAENLGGKETPTSANTTNVGKRRPTPEEPGPSFGDSLPPVVADHFGGAIVELADGTKMHRLEYLDLMHDRAARRGGFEDALARDTRSPSAGLTEPQVLRAEGSLPHEAAPVEGSTNPTRELDNPTLAKGSNMPTQGLGSEPTRIRDEFKFSNQTVRDYLESLGHQYGPRHSPGDQAAANLEHAINQIDALSEGKFSAVSALEVAQRLGVKDMPRGPLAERMIQLWGLRQLAKESAAAVKGSQHASGHLVKKAMGYALGAAGLKHHGPIGFMVGHALGNSGVLASSAGKFREAIISAANTLLKGKRSQVAARMANYAAYSYDGSKPTTDVKQRVEQLHRALVDIDGTRTRIMNSLGEIHTQDPQLAGLIADKTIGRLQNLSISAPVFIWRNGRELEPTLQAVRAFRQMEEATWNPEHVLNAVKSGSVTPQMARALNLQHPEMVRVLAGQLLGHDLTHVPKSTLHQIELITGAQLTGASDPAFVGRQQLRFQPLPEHQSPDSRPQHLSGQPATPGQSQLRAPGNMPMGQ